MTRLLAAGVLATWVASVISSPAATITEQIDAILARSAVSANTWTVLIENENGSATYYQKNPNTGKAPASNTKMVTTAAAFALLGTNHSFESRIYRDGTYTGGVLTGNLNLVCEHDMTWNTSVFGSSNPRKGLDRIASQLKALGLTQVLGNVQVYGVCIYNYGSTDSTKDTSNQATYNAEGATAFVAALVAQGISVSGSALGKTGFTAPGILMYTHRSSDVTSSSTYGSVPLRLENACIPLMKVSHNPMADMLLRHIGYKLTGTDSFTAGKNQVFAWLANSVGLSTANMVMNDGSGLSWNNRFSARDLLTLTRHMLNTYPSWDNTLPIGCRDGTIGSRFCSTDGSGQVHAKTGTLSISVALSGYIDNKYDNRRYLFSFVANHGSNIDETATRDAIDDCVVLLGARGVPIGPQILSVTNNGNNKALTVNWSDDGFVRTGYKLYASSNGINFEAPINLASTKQSHTENTVAAGAKRYYRVSVMSSSGESPSSRVYGAQVANAPSPVLIVDGNDRWQCDPTDNPNATNHSFAAIAGQSISGPAFDTVHHNAIIDGTFALTNYRAVIWLLGEESTADRSFNSTEQSLVSTYLQRGGNLFVSGAEIGWDLDRVSGPSAADRNFYHNQLRALLNGDAADDAGTYSFLATNGIFAGNPASGFDNGTFGTFNVAFPDVLTPTNGSVACLLYAGNRGNAGVQYDGGPNGPKIVNWGFPFETITNSAARDAYMSDVLRFFALINPPQLLTAQPNQMNNSISLNWSASAGIKYRVQYKTDLNHGAWIDMPPDVTATNTAASKTDSLGSTQRFYRVLLLN